MIAERDLILSADLPAQLKEERVLNAAAYDTVRLRSTISRPRRRRAARTCRIV